jgi:hypothetical protein
MTDCKLLTAAEDMTTLLKLESSEKFESQLLFHQYWLAQGRHCLRNKKVSISLFGMILESQKYFTLAISLYKVKHSCLLLNAIEVSLGNGHMCTKFSCHTSLCIRCVCIICIVYCVLVLYQ